MIGIWIAYTALAAFGLYLVLCAGFGRHSRRTHLRRTVPPGPAGAHPAARSGIESFFRQVAGLYVHRSSGR